VFLIDTARKCWLAYADGDPYKVSTWESGANPQSTSFW